jgi:hypothetical protein
MSPASQAKVNALLQVAFAPQAARALTRAAASAKVAMVRAIANDLSVKQSVLKGYIWADPARADRLVARVTPRGGKLGIPLVKFGATGPEPSHGKGNGVRVGSTRYPNAFIATMPKSGHRGVFQRKGKARLPIVELRTMPLQEAFRRARPIGLARATEALRTNLQSELRFALRRSA